jgi:hypothetical protein
MFNIFSERFNLSRNEGQDRYTNMEIRIPQELFYLFQNFGGANVNNGLYKIHTIDSWMIWAKDIATLFPSYTDSIYPFAFDWLGRQFCLSKENSKNILMFDPATVEDFELETDLVSFHNIDLVEDTDDMLSQDDFMELLTTRNLKGIKYNECLSHRVPLLLNGEDTADNLELSDIDVYWHMQSQIYSQIKDLPDGTTVSSFIFTQQKKE